MVLGYYIGSSVGGNRVKPIADQKVAKGLSE